MDEYTWTPERIAEARVMATFCEPVTLPASQLRALLDEVERLQAVIAAAEDLMAQLDACDVASRYVWNLAAIHGLAYDGPTYSEQRAALKDAIEAAKGGG